MSIYTLGGLILYIREVKLRRTGGHIHLRCNLKDIEWLDPYSPTSAGEERLSGSLVSRMKQETETYTKVCLFQEKLEVRHACQLSHTPPCKES